MIFQQYRRHLLVGRQPDHGVQTGLFAYHWGMRTRGGMPPLVQQHLYHATSALVHNADLAKVQAWAGHATMATTRFDEHRQSRPAERLTFQVEYCAASVLRLQGLFASYSACSGWRSTTACTTA
jgi:hypothetical protein